MKRPMRQPMRLPERALAVLLLLAAQLALATVAWAQGSYKAEPVGALTAADVPKALEDALAPQGARLVNDKGAPVGELWTLKSVALGAASANSDAVYSTLSVGTLVGVLHFPAQASDFRGQTIKAGYYTLRYAKMPQDGNHMGANPYPDFLLLCPAASDTQVGQALKLDDLLNLSRKASGTAHPAVMSLIPVGQGAKFPSAAMDDKGNAALQVKLSGGGQEVPLALVLVGQVAAT